jgi:hypothetical protein
MGPYGLGSEAPPFDILVAKSKPASKASYEPNYHTRHKKCQTKNQGTCIVRDPFDHGQEVVGEAQEGSGRRRRSARCVGHLDNIENCQLKERRVVQSQNKIWTVVNMGTIPRLKQNNSTKISNCNTYTQAQTCGHGEDNNKGTIITTIERRIAHDFTSGKTGGIRNNGLERKQLAYVTRLN